MIQWLDHPFVDLLSQIKGLLPYFMIQARYLAGFLLLLNISLSSIKYAITHQGIKDDIVKTATALVFFVIIINLYPAIINGLNRIVYKWAMNSTYTKVLAQTIDKTRQDSEFWAKKGDKAEDAYSDIIKKVAVVEGDGQVGYRYILDVYLPGTGYFSPSAMMRVVMLILDNILTKANSLSRNAFGIVHDMSSYIMLLLTALCVLFASIFGLAQYFLGAVEFQLIAAVGIITLPGMLWNSTKFLTEKLIGAILGFFIKMLFVSIAVMLMFNGLLVLMTKEFAGAIDQLVYTIFTCFLYVMFCQSAPALAVSLLTGSPQMSLMEAGAAAASIAAGVYGAQRIGGAVAGTAARGGTSLSGGFIKTIGASMQGAQDAAASGKSLPGAIGAGMLSGAVSTGHSVLKTAGSITNSIGRSLTGRRTENKHSSLERFQKGSSFDSGSVMSGSSPDPDNADVGKARSVTDYFRAKYSEGRNFAKGRFASEGTARLDTAQTENRKAFETSYAYSPRLNERTFQKLPPAFAPNALPKAKNPEGLPPPSSTPSRLTLPPPKNYPKN